MAKKNYDYVIKPPNYFLYLAIISIILFVFLISKENSKQYRVQLSIRRMKNLR